MEPSFSAEFAQVQRSRPATGYGTRRGLKSPADSADALCMSWLIILMAVVAAVAVVVSALAVLTSGRNDEALERDEREISAGRHLDGLRHW